MTDANEQSIPSRGSHSEPVGWQATDEFGHPAGFLSWKDDETRWPKNESVPLYLQPKPTLTDEEREAVEYLLLGGCEGPEDKEAAVRTVVRRLLERTK